MGVGAEKRQCLSPAPFSAHRKSAQIRPKMARTPSLGLGYSLSLKEATQRLTRANTRDFYVGCLWDDTTSRRKRMCAFTACVRFLRRRGPAGLRSLFFGYSVVIFALPHGLSSTRKQWDKTGRTQRPPQSRQKRIEVLLWLGCSPPLKNRTQRLTGANKGYLS